MISLVIPCFNEELRLADSLEKLVRFLEKFSEETEIIVVDDFSTDQTQKIARSFSGKLKNLKITQPTKGKGKGAAVNQGFLEAKGDIVVFSDADFSTPIEEITKLLSALESGSDIVVGSRALNRGLIKLHQNFLRETMGKVFNLLVQLIAVKGISDTQCGFKAFKKTSCEKIFAYQRIWDFGFDVELLYLAQRSGLKIVEIPVLWYNNPSSKVSPIIDSVTSFLDLLKIRFYHYNLKNN